MRQERLFVVYKAGGGRHGPARNVSEHINEYKYKYVTNQGLSSPYLSASDRTIGSV